jgi:hypothetical protein
MNILHVSRKHLRLLGKYSFKSIEATVYDGAESSDFFELFN